jgi:hypothetical protein
MFCGGGTGFEYAWISLPARRRIFLARIKTVAAGSKFSYPLRSTQGKTELIVIPTTIPLQSETARCS